MASCKLLATIIGGARRLIVAISAPTNQPAWRWRANLDEI